MFTTALAETSTSFLTWNLVCEWIESYDEKELLTTTCLATTISGTVHDISNILTMTNECVSYVETMPTQELTNGLDLLNQKEKMLKLEQQNDNKLVKTLKRF